jgi:hypothetical protein
VQVPTLHPSAAVSAFVFTVNVIGAPALADRNASRSATAAVSEQKTAERISA